jgi:hypothetical protein
MSYIYNAKILIFERVILKYEFKNRPYAYSFFFILELRDYLLIDSPVDWHNGTRSIKNNGNEK